MEKYKINNKEEIIKVFNLIAKLNNIPDINLLIDEDDYPEKYPSILVLQYLNDDTMGESPTMGESLDYVFITKEDLK